MKDFVCGTCPFWHEHKGFKFEPPPGMAPELIAELKDRRPGDCYGVPPRVHLIPKMVRQNVLLGDSPQQGMAFQPQPFRPPLLDNEPACALHPLMPEVFDEWYEEQAKKPSGTIN